eukprot:GILI01034986.1.p1 GENE.GILI01034986.1~~GILI01034986.1.p1  ORF type:complete len:174 (-),score=14.79 GILI01034986.1:98-619(-)
MGSVEEFQQVFKSECKKLQEGGHSLPNAVSILLDRLFLSRSAPHFNVEELELVEAAGLQGDDATRALWIRHEIALLKDKFDISSEEAVKYLIERFKHSTEPKSPVPVHVYSSSVQSRRRNHSPEDPRFVKRRRNSASSSNSRPPLSNKNKRSLAEAADPSLESEVVTKKPFRR